MLLILRKPWCSIRAHKILGGENCLGEGVTGIVACCPPLSAPLTSHLTRSPPFRPHPSPPNLKKGFKNQIVCHLFQSEIKKAGTKICIETCSSVAATSSSGSAEKSGESREHSPCLIHCASASRFPFLSHAAVTESSFLFSPSALKTEPNPPNGTSNSDRCKEERKALQ